LMPVSCLQNYLQGLFSDLEKWHGWWSSRRWGGRCCPACLLFGCVGAAWIIFEEKEIANDMMQSLIFMLCPKMNVCEQVSHCWLAWVYYLWFFTTLLYRLINWHEELGWFSRKKNIVIDLF
jgi:hypothetical protein